MRLDEIEIVTVPWCSRDECPVCGGVIEYDRDYTDEVYAYCTTCNYRAFDHYKHEELV